ncbi:hypothetical protein A2348_04500 [Candidatus Uhrbacteria bacterium RIFOXYB12_FULL_58_10]|uniref:Uncharacterized protein n=1 Tax=Candidatus Uhrbacteria bacterium RIFOXYB2_FULL_57_15 TaxID=1802422 RepID=A0A1F7W7G9_9BACT|nr:MAG: hypothetical protein A2348_04500 [Candidatus Uhrbacteria bacterium RIFOXYB12_FULL_58_10]OGL98743.1 MAG: hypothetical protein A2304_01005 [Candidatus Uhrbacteria bacterium RIFOXYB2_FULL_57_15]OGL99948.1 MAG: hypothetical protein A2501_04335 [Candidatus Uhrbacteria bacterium RIFOXYC12_FULL_57_11]
MYIRLSLFDRFKASAWAVLAPVFPYVRDALLRLGIIRHNIRQNFLIGYLAPGRSVQGLIEHLKTHHGFCDHRIAWVDSDEIIGLRKLANFHFQYHLRVFMDREIRVHFEYTPESRPFDHLAEACFEDRREEFLRFLEDWIVVAFGKEKDPQSS